MTEEPASAHAGTCCPMSLVACESLGANSEIAKKHVSASAQMGVESADEPLSRSCQTTPARARWSNIMRILWPLRPVIMSATTGMRQTVRRYVLQRCFGSQLSHQRTVSAWTRRVEKALARRVPGTLADAPTAQSRAASLVARLDPSNMRSCECATGAEVRLTQTIPKRRNHDERKRWKFGEACGGRGHGDFARNS